ncbi:hypothetical protein ABI59_22030 [Acidobacteria bacterium Mor1]|nr:hypothetical protein ABI59_22030 [Acidobacteria bacterium Mor1]
MHKILELEHSAGQAFDHFVQGIGTWWPLDAHSLGEEKAETVVMESKVGGRLYEIWQDGTQKDWGEVLAFDPPNHVAFSWVLNGAPEDATRVEVRFTPLGESRCRMELIHSGWESRSDGALWRERYHSGWDGVLARFVA